MNQLLIAIATLCLMPNGSVDRKYTYDKQLECQQEYLECVDKKFNVNRERAFDFTAPKLLKECVLEK